MTARILVVDDVAPNVKLLEARLSSEYFDVLTASSGLECLSVAEQEKPDLILLDVMMPGMDGLETCRRLKAGPETTHIPVIMITALTDPADRVRGLEAGADDFLSKPIDDVALLARVRSLIRLKMTIDEWRIREKTARQFNLPNQDEPPSAQSVNGARALVIEDRPFEAEKFVETLRRDQDEVRVVRSGEEALALARAEDFDVIAVSLGLEREDGLRLCSHLRSNEKTRAVPILMIGQEGDMKRIAQGLEIGVHDYIIRPVDPHELLARVRTQVRRKRYQERLRLNYEASLSMAMTDSLTGLFNRRYLMAHLEKLLRKNAEEGKTLCVLTLDVDHFKKINDSHGHGVGDEVLKIFAERMAQRLRGFDLLARLGGEEFVAVLPDVDAEMAAQVAERLRQAVAAPPFRVGPQGADLTVTVSIGGTLIQGSLTPEEALRRSDAALYRAKAEGRDRCRFETPATRSQAGSAFFLILIGIVLFAALNYTFTRSGRTRGNLTTEQAGMAANEIMRFAEDMHTAAQASLNEGLSTSQLSFENGQLTGYANINAGAVKLLDATTGGLRYARPSPGWLQSNATGQPFFGEWYFPARTCVSGAGAGGAACNADAAVNEDLVALLPYINRDICVTVNKRLGVPLCAGDACENASSVFPAGGPRFTGLAQTDGAMIRTAGGETDGHTEGCVKGGGMQTGFYFYYKVLAER